MANATKPARGAKFAWQPGDIEWADDAAGETPAAGSSGRDRFAWDAGDLDIISSSGAGGKPNGKAAHLRLQVKLDQPDWDPHKHPRGRDGKFIRVGDRVKLSLGGAGRVLAITDGGQIAVQRDDGKRVMAKPEQVTQLASDAKKPFTAPKPAGTPKTAGNKPDPTPAPAAPKQVPEAAGNGKPSTGDRLTLPDGSGGMVVAMVGEDRVAVVRDDGGRAIHNLNEVTPEGAAPKAPAKPQPDAPQPKAGSASTPDTPVFLTGRDGHRQLTAPEMSEEERAVLGEYVSMGHYTINNQLRTGFEWPSFGKMTTAEKIEHMDAVMERAAIDEPMVVYRGINVFSQTKFDFDTIKIGALLVDKGYFSTSMDEGIGRGFAKSGVMFRIEVPAGTRAMPIEGTSDKEAEVLFDRGSALRIKAVTGEPGNYTVHAELVQPQKAPAAPATKAAPATPGKGGSMFEGGDGQPIRAFDRVQLPDGDQGSVVSRRDDGTVVVERDSTGEHITVNAGELTHPGSGNTSGPAAAPTTADDADEDRFLMPIDQVQILPPGAEVPPQDPIPGASAFPQQPPKRAQEPPAAAKTGAPLRLELKRRTARWNEHDHPRDNEGQFAHAPGFGTHLPKPKLPKMPTPAKPADARRFATRADDARRGQGQTRSNFVHPVTGAPMGKTETGDTYEALFEAKGAPLLVAKYGGEFHAVATTGSWQSRNTPLDFQVDGRGGELKSLSARTPNQKTAIKAEEIARKKAAVEAAGLDPLLVVQVIDQDAGRVEVYAYEEFASKAVKRMEHLGSYSYSVEDFEAAQRQTGHHDKREQRAAAAQAAGKAAPAGRLVDDDGNEIEPGDLVIELRAGVPYVYTHPAATQRGSLLVKVGKPDWDPDEHPRDRHGQFVHVGDAVRLLSGGTGTYQGIDRAGRVRVKRPDGSEHAYMRSQVEFPGGKPAGKTSPTAGPSRAKAAAQEFLDGLPDFEKDWIRNRPTPINLVSSEVRTFLGSQGFSPEALEEHEKLLRNHGHTHATPESQHSVDTAIRDAFFDDKSEVGAVFRALSALNNAAYDMWAASHDDEHTPMFRYGAMRETTSFNLGSPLEDFERDNGSAIMATLPELRAAGYVLVVGPAGIVGASGEAEYFLVQRPGAPAPQVVKKPGFYSRVKPGPAEE